MLFLLRLRRSLGGGLELLSATILVGLVLIALGAPLISGDPANMNFDQQNVILLAPSLEFPLGTDALGRDILNQIIWGARTSLVIALVSAFVSTFVGTVVGAFSGFLGGKADILLMRLVDSALMIPRFFLILMIIAIFGASMINVIAAIALTTWPETARLVRIEVLGQRQRDYAKAARISGAGTLRILFGEIMPNAIQPVIVKTSLLTGQAILLEASLGFLGLADPSVVSWGQMIKEALPVFRTAWWTLIAPGLMVTLTIASFNILGDALQGAFNPRLQQ